MRWCFNRNIRNEKYRIFTIGNRCIDTFEIFDKKLTWRHEAMTASTAWVQYTISRQPLLKILVLGCFGPAAESELDPLTKHLKLLWSWTSFHRINKHNSWISTCHQSISQGSAVPQRTWGQCSSNTRLFSWIPHFDDLVKRSRDKDFLISS